MLLVLATFSAVLALGGTAGLQTGHSVALLGGEHVDAFGQHSKRSGGLLFDLQSQQFSNVPESGVERAQHTACDVDGLWYLFGGASSGVQTFDPRTSSYADASVAPSGVVPAPRVGHSAVAFGGALYVLGGELNDGSLDGALRVYDIASGVWRELASPLGGIAEHSAVVKDGLMWVFGGRDASGAPLAGLWTFDLRTELWAEAESSPSSASLAAAAAADEQQQQQGPSARFGHAAALIGDEILIFGGQLAGGRFANDVWALHADARQRLAPSWQRAAIVDGGTAPAARADAVVALYDNALWVLGGRDAAQTFLDVWALDLEYLQWELIACLPGAAFPHCREAAIKMSPPADEPLSAFRFVNPGVSEATYSVQLHSQPTQPVTVSLDVDASHVQLSPSELVFDETNWNAPQTVRVLVLEDLFLPGDAGELTITHATRTLDQHYKRSVLAPRQVSLPSICGDGRCLGDENQANCALDCRNAGAAPFCGDGLCHEETYQSCPDDCSVQGTDNSCAAATPVRCRSGDCAATPAACATRSRSTSQSCADDGANCRGAVLLCAAGESLCADGSCAASADAFAPLEPCAAGLKRCFDTSCQRVCGADADRCPPARRNLNLLDARCRADPSERAEVAIEHAHRDPATLSTIHRPLSSTSRVWLLAAHGSQYYGQLAFPGGALDGERSTTCPCSDTPLEASSDDPMVGVKVVVVADDELPAGAFGGFDLTLPGNHSGSFSPHVAQIWLSHLRTDIARYCLGAYRADADAWFCVDESLHTSSADAACNCTIKHTRGSFGHNYGRFAFIVDNCVGLDNADQADADNDGVGDACDSTPYGGAEIDLSCGGDVNKGYIDEIIDELKLNVTELNCPSSPYI